MSARVRSRSRERGNGQESSNLVEPVLVSALTSYFHCQKLILGEKLLN